MKTTHVHLIAALLALPTAAPAEEKAFQATPAEVDAFVQADADKDGVLTRAEFRVFVRAMAKAGQPTARQIRIFGAYGIAFGITDADRNGVVTPAEMRAADTTHRSGKGPVRPPEE